ncbi:MAG TPA: hydroxymethylbilane synthase [Candidatus Saccharimonadia bacterium]|jgi:hydroxymethylbilane synthase
MTLKVGTRGSKLALIQTQLVTEALQQLEPGLEIKVVIIKTEGDKNFAPIPLDTIGKAWFTAEIDRALTERDIDLAVHSLKDLPLTLDAGLTMITVLERADPRDVLVSRSGQTLDQLPPGAIIGTDSTRRRALLLHHRPDLQVTSLRGNVQTRLRKLQDREYDGIILAAAGLDRLGELSRVSEFLDPTRFPPSSGQGALAVEIRRDDTLLLNLLQRLEHSGTLATTAAERAFSATIGGGCKLPVACYAQAGHRQLHLYGMIAELGGDGILFDQISGPINQATGLGESLARRLLEKCSFNFQPEYQ